MDYEPDESNWTDSDLIAEALTLGADAALSMASWLEMSEADATSILDDIDPEVLDRYRGPDLSGEWADGPTPLSVAREITGQNDVDGTTIDTIADAWLSAADEIWEDVLQAEALRTLSDAYRARADAVHAEIKANREHYRQARQS